MVQNEEWEDGKAITLFDSFTFEKIRKLKEKGGYGEIFLVRLKDRSDKFVVKKPLLYNLEVTDLERPRAIRKEARILLTIPSHENIVECLLVERIKGITHVFMEYYSGGDLEDYINDKSVFDWITYFLVINQIINGMIHIHSNGMIHGDLKPSNILISDATSINGKTIPIIKITDFGLSKIYSLEKSKQKLSEIEFNYEKNLGRFVSEFYTPCYAPPEQDVWKGNGISPASDIFSFGIIMIELLTGILYFKDKINYKKFARNNENTLLSRAIISYVKEWREDVPEQLLTIINKCLEISPHKRYQSFDQILKDIQKAKMQQIKLTLRISRSTEFKILSHGLKGYSLARLGFREDAKEQFKHSVSFGSATVADFIHQGLSFYDLGNYEKAIESYDKILNSPDRATLDRSIILGALINKSSALDMLGKHGESIECCDEALQIDSSNTVALNNKGLALMHKNENDQAIKLFDEALSINPDNFYSLYNKGQALFHSGKYIEAIDSFSLALNLEPMNTNALEARAACQLKIANYGAATKDFDEVLSSEPDRIEVARQKLIALFNSQEYNKAVILSDNILTSTGNDLEIMFIKEMSLANLGKINESTEILDNILKIDPKNIKALIRKSFTAIEELNDFEKSIGYCRVILELDPQNIDALHNIGLSLNYLNKLTEAVKYYDAALAINPNFIPVLINKAVLLLNLGQTKEALYLIDNALKVNPNSKEALINKVIIQEELGQFENAIQEIDNLLAKEPDNPYLLNRKGVIFGKSKRFDKAIECFDKALEIDPDNEAIKGNKKTATEFKKDFIG